MKRIWPAVIGAAIAVLPSAAFAQMPNWTNGIYVRGDLGAGFGSESTERDTDPNATNFSLGTTQITGSTGTGFLGDVGVGFRVSPVFRIEATYLHLGSMDFRGNFAPGPGSARASVSADIGMANAYIDLDTWTTPVLARIDPMLGKLQPFLVGGLGVTVNHNGDETDSLGGVPVNSFAGADHTDFAWALGAGVGYPICDGVVVDLMYRYLDLGQRLTGTVLSDSSGARAVQTPDTANLQTHVVTVGLRWTF
jgi:opacity protein-like surface antigen